MNCCNLLKLLASRFHLSSCQSGNRYDYIHVEGVLDKGPDPSDPRYADPLPVLHHWQLYLSTSGINEYSTTR